MQGDDPLTTRTNSPAPIDYANRYTGRHRAPPSVSSLVTGLLLLFLSALVLMSAAQNPDIRDSTRELLLTVEIVFVFFCFLAGMFAIVYALWRSR